MNSQSDIKKWERYLKLREEILKALEIARKDYKIIDTFLSAEVFVKAGEELKPYLENSSFWEYFLMVSKFELTEEIKKNKESEIVYQAEEINDLVIKIKPTGNKKCERCWQRKPEVGKLEIPDLCNRCYEVIKSLNKQ